MKPLEQDIKLSIFDEIKTLLKHQAEQVKELNKISQTLEKFTDQYQQLERWSGEYRSIEMSTEHRITNREIDLGIRGRTLSIRTDQDITIRLNSKDNDEITVRRLEEWVLIGNLKSDMLISRLFISTNLPFIAGATAVNVRILSLG